MPGTLLIATLNLMWLTRLKAMLAGWKVRISQEDIHTIIIVVSLSRIAEETQDMVVQGQRISTSTTV
jgi:hypothetical protein